MVWKTGTDLFINAMRKFFVTLGLTVALNMTFISSGTNRTFALIGLVCDFQAFSTTKQSIIL